VKTKQILPPVTDTVSGCTVEIAKWWGAGSEEVELHFHVPDIIK
jgi:hypothetical protein